MKEQHESQSSIEKHVSAVREMTQYYLTQRNERVKGLVALQGLLFAALGFAWDKDPFLTVLLGVVGVASNLCYFAYIDESENAVREIRSWWVSRLECMPEYDGLPPTDLPTSKKDRFSGHRDPVNFLVGIFGFAWGVILAMVVFTKLVGA